MSDFFTDKAKVLRGLAPQVMAIAEGLNDKGKMCECCGAVRYENFRHRQAIQRIRGAADRLTELADLFERRSGDPESQMDWRDYP